MITLKKRNLNSYEDKNNISYIQEKYYKPNLYREETVAQWDIETHFSQEIEFQFP